MTIENTKKQPTLPGHFVRGSLPKLNKALSRDSVSRQIFKICYS